MTPPAKAALAQAVLCAAALSTPHSLAQDVTIDGSTLDWPTGEHVQHDESYVYALLEFDEPVTVYRPGFEVNIRINGDADASTGGPDGEEMWISFGYRGPGAESGSGLLVTTYAADGTPAPAKPADHGIIASPTHASRAFELRISRADPALELRDAGPVAITIELDKPSGLESHNAIRELGSAYAEPRHGRPVPTKPEGAIRVMSWNVLWGGASAEPDAHARVINAMRPDVVLVQEWTRGETPAEQVADWFDANAPWGKRINGRGWNAASGDGWGVAVATPHPVSARGPQRLMAGGGGRWDFPVRLASAAIDTPAGEIVFGSIHYKCCGSLDSAEDARRLVEAAAVRGALRTLAERSEARPVVLGGDFNLVGANTPLFRSIDGLDTDGSDLRAADAAVLNGAAVYTQGGGDSDYMRSRLDFITYPDAAYEVVNAFVLDTALLSESELNRLNLRRTDHEASDHLPIVVDLRPRP